MPIRQEANIRCSIFQKQEPVIKEFTDMLNKANGYQRKVELASDLLRNVDVLLNCSEYNPNTLDCKNCRFISNLRKKAANIVIKARKLAK